MENYDLPEPPSLPSKSFETQHGEIFFQLFESAPDGILVVDANGLITQVNPRAEKMFGFDRKELIGHPIEILIPHRFGGLHTQHRRQYMEEPRTRPMGASLDLFARRKDGTEFPVDIMLSPVNHLVLAVVRDITERKAIEARVNEAMRLEMHLKEVHHQELHHRIKNNLQVISSLLFLQSTYINDDAIHEILRESQNRVKSIALIHEKLYRSETMGKLDFAEYVSDLLANLFNTYCLEEGGVTIHTEIRKIHLGIDTAIPCGLILNELVSNAFKHAFPKGRNGYLQIELYPIPNGQFVLSVSDDGIGFPPTFDWKHAPSFGLKLVVDLTKQLDGKLEVINVSPGTTFRITFRELEYRERG